MAYLVAIGLSCIALGGFILMTMFEQSRGTRLFADMRGELDRRVERAQFVLAHVDWGAFLADVTRTSLERALHDVAHTTLILVRALERELTRTVRALRARRAGLSAPRAERPNLLASATAYLRATLRAARRPRRSLDLPAPSAEEETRG